MNHYVNLGFTPLQIEKCREAFDLFDVNDNEYIEIAELRAALENMGHQPTEEELYRMMNEGDLNGECKIGFEAFMKIILNQKKKSEDLLKNDIINAFVALGGIQGQDGEVEHGKIDLLRIKEVVKREFNMDIDLCKLGIGDENEDQEVGFKEFMELMSS